MLDRIVVELSRQQFFLSMALIQSGHTTSTTSNKHHVDDIISITIMPFHNINEKGVKEEGMILSLVSSLLVTSALGHFRSSTSDTFIYDDDNRVSFFHGTNFVQKGYPWYPEVLLDSKNIEG